MHRKKSFFALLVMSAACAIFSAGLHAQLIEPTRSIESASDEAGFLNVLSEPPGIDVQLDGIVIGKTPIFSTQLTPGSHVLRMKGSETDIYLDAGKTFTITWFKGSFIKIPETAKPSAEIIKEPKPPPAKPKTDEGPGVHQKTINDAYYWPLNPRGPIY